MAIKETATNNYFKIDFEGCAVRGLKVFVKFVVYKDANERDKEKQRQDKWAVFFQKLRENLQGYYEDILTKLQAEGLTLAEVLSPDEDSKIDKDKYPHLRAMQDKMNALEPYERIITRNLFHYAENERQLIAVPNEVLDELIALGFEEEWISEPVILSGGAEVYTGEYNNEPITYELFYERLKSVMGATEDYLASRALWL